MRRLHRHIQRVAALLLAIILLAAAGPALAHKDHDKLGAGPGPSAEEQAVANAVTPVVAAPVDMANMHENMAEGHEMAMDAHEQAADENRTFGERLVNWLGRLHTLLVHFPIAMFTGALLVELYGLWRKNREFQRAAHVMLVVGALGAVVAAVLGWFAGGFYLSDRNQVLMVHRWLGTAIAAFGFVLLYLAAAGRRAPEKPRTVYWILLASMTVAIAVQGFLGGTFMHGGMGHMDF